MLICIVPKAEHLLAFVPRPFETHKVQSTLWILLQNIFHPCCRYAFISRRAAPTLLHRLDTNLIHHIVMNYLCINQMSDFIFEASATQNIRNVII